MTRDGARRRRNASSLAAAVAGLALQGCATLVEVPVETPLQSKLDVSSFRRVLFAGFVTDAADTDVDAGSETIRLLQNQLRAASRLQVLEPDRPPLAEELDRTIEDLGPDGRNSREGRERLALEADRLLQDPGFWRRLGEEYQTPLIVTGRVKFEVQNRSGFQADERVMREPGTGQPRLVRSSRYTERRGFALSAEFIFVDGRSGESLHRERFTEEVLYGLDQKVSPLSAYFELMDRLLPNFLGVISPQRIRGTRVLLY